MLRHLFLVAVALSGCKSDPYCLNCGKTSGGFGGDGGQRDLSGADFAAAPLPDLSGGGGGDGFCLPSNGGVENGDGIDNDCNGKIDDNVDPSKLQNDPNNCGSCGNACNYAATHQFGACMGGSCMPSGCVPGFVDADGNPANGCEYKCAPSLNDLGQAIEVCDGVDNNCDGRIDEGFTATWNAAGKPNYDSDIGNCGGCGFICNLQGAVDKCVADSSGKGVCEVDHCINNPGADTFKHNPANGDINTSGCEYHCPTASATAGDCNAAVNTCTFPAETCNGADDDCNFIVDDNLTDPSLNTPCGQTCPSPVPAAKCQCKAGTIQCLNHVLLCQGGVGPGTEVCDGLDNNCNGEIDEPFTAPSPGGYLNGDTSQPLYNIDPNNCGGCGNTFKCQLAHATNGCHGSNTQGNCFVVSCASGFNYATRTDSNPANPTCDVVSAARDSTAGNVASGVGCNYACPAGSFPASSEAICDGKDNNCDGCIDNGLTAPSGICAKQGVCNGASIPIVCKGASGWKCNYAAVAGIDVDAMGNLASIETECDGRDNNCNGFCDENFPSTATPNNAAICARNPGRVASACTSGQGLCQTSGTFCCGAVDGFCSPAPSPAFKVVCSTQPNVAAAQNETCNGIDDNCNGLIDDPNPANGKAGYRDATVTIAVPAGDTSPLLNPTPAPAHTVYIYPFEASRPDSSNLSPGGNSSRACTKTGVMPWSGATQDQARAACAAAGGRLCSAFEWQTSCEGPLPTPTPAPVYSYSANTGAYTAGVCNDQNRVTPNAVWTTGHPPNSGVTTCSISWPTGAISDLSGNLFEWSSTPVLFASLAGGAAAVVNGTGGTNGQMRIQGLLGLLAAGAAPGDVIQLTGSVANNGDYAIVTVIDDTSVIVVRPGFAGGNANGLGWSLFSTYYKIRGGSFSSPGGGTSCEFDFDLVPPTFTNNDVGFRCCFDKKPCAANADCTGIGSGVCTNGACP